MTFRIVSEEEKRQEEVLDAIRTRHHHDDGSEPVLSLADKNPGIERKLAEEENLWKIKTQQRSQRSRETETREKQPVQQQRNNDEIPHQRQQQVMAGCNCGKSFSAEKSEGKISITSFDNAGNVSGTYTVKGSSSEKYGVTGTQKEPYSASGSTNENYGK